MARPVGVVAAPVCGRAALAEVQDRESRTQLCQLADKFFVLTREVVNPERIAGAESTTTPSRAWIAWVPALAFGVAHVALKAPRLSSSSFWLDEAVGVHIAQLDLPGIIRASREGTTPPLYYLVLGGFERLFGLSEAALRWPSVVASAATAGVLILFARRRLGNLAAWLASVLFLLSDVNLRYAREARPYALASLLCVLSFALFFRALERPSRSVWVAVAAVNGLMLFTTYATVFAVAAQCLALLWPWRGWAALRRFALSHSALGAALLVWMVPLLSSGVHHRMDWLPPPSLRPLNSLLALFAAGLSGGPGFYVLFAGAGAAFVITRSSGLAVPWKLLAPLLLWGLSPVLLAFGASFFVRCFHARYLLYATPGLTLLWAAAAQMLPAGRLRILGATLACLVTVMGFGRSARHHVADWREAAEMIHTRPADRVLLYPSYEVPPFAYYYDPAAFRDTLNTVARLAMEGVRTVDDGTDLGALDLGTVREVLLVVAGSGRRGESVKRQLAAQGFVGIERRNFQGVTLLWLASSRASPALPSP